MGGWTVVRARGLRLGLVEQVGDAGLYWGGWKTGGGVGEQEGGGKRDSGVHTAPWGSGDISEVWETCCHLVRGCTGLGTRGTRERPGPRVTQGEAAGVRSSIGRETSCSWVLLPSPPQHHRLGWHPGCRALWQKKVFPGDWVLAAPKPGTFAGSPRHACAFLPEQIRTLVPARARQPSAIFSDTLFMGRSPVSGRFCKHTHCFPKGTFHWGSTSLTPRQVALTGLGVREPSAVTDAGVSEGMGWSSSGCRLPCGSKQKAQCQPLPCPAPDTRVNRALSPLPPELPAFQNNPEPHWGTVTGLCPGGGPLACSMRMCRMPPPSGCLPAPAFSGASARWQPILPRDRRRCGSVSGSGLPDP